MSIVSIIGTGYMSRTIGTLAVAGGTHRRDHRPRPVQIR